MLEECAHHTRIETAFGPFCMVCGHLEEQFTHTPAVSEEPLGAKPIEIKVKARSKHNQPTAHARAPFEKASIKIKVN